MHKKELEKLYYIFIDNTFAPSSINTEYCNQKNIIAIMFSFINQGNNQRLPSSTIVTNTGEKGESINFCYYAAFFIKLSLEQDNHNGLLSKNTMGQSRDGVIKYIKNYIHDEKYSQIFYEVLGKYLSDDYTFDTILKKCLDTKRSIASKAKENTSQHKSKMTHKQSTSGTLSQSSTVRGGFMVPYNNTIHSQSTNTPSVNTSSAIRTYYTVPLIVSLIPLLVLFYCTIRIIIKCCHYVSKRRVRERRENNDNELHIFEPEVVQFRDKKTHNNKKKF